MPGKVIVGGSGYKHKVMGEVEEQIWTVIAADTDGEIDHEEIGKRVRTRRVYFAYRDEALAWIVEQERQGFTCESGPVAAATFYFGPTDSPSNCWSAEVTKPYESDPSPAEMARIASDARTGLDPRD